MTSKETRQRVATENGVQYLIIEETILGGLVREIRRCPLGAVDINLPKSQTAIAKLQPFLKP